MKKECKNYNEKKSEQNNFPLIECVTFENAEFTTCSPGCCSPVEDCSPCDY